MLFGQQTLSEPYSPLNLPKFNNTENIVELSNEIQPSTPKDRLTAHQIFNQKDTID